eukprot:Gregarina_sp_Poly_1__761@NODE_1182_length_4849_cov_31_140945_g812_i0_p2_GENE_NODE_1182_length_4849_cov_31_140945_g812_i0NODE_1182_length_4849_cov_31_140945_g812_i0_p2_ORF_typecomplete_len300_score50_30_NODE_1182_length_4849_cov_31_140945_g812_i030223921
MPNPASLFFLVCSPFMLNEGVAVEDYTFEAEPLWLTGVDLDQLFETPSIAPSSSSPETHRSFDSALRIERASSVYPQGYVDSRIELPPPSPLQREEEEHSHLLIFPSELGYPASGALSTNDSDHTTLKKLVTGQISFEDDRLRLSPGPPWLHPPGEEPSHPESDKVETISKFLWRMPRVVDEVAETASRWSNFAAEGTVNRANLMNNLRHQALDRWVDLMNVADRRARTWASADLEFLKKSFDAQRNFIDAWGRLGDRVIQRTAETASLVSERVYDAYVRAEDLPAFLNLLADETSPPT